MNFLSSMTTENLKILGIYLPILASLIFFIYTDYKDRLLKRKEYADKIRTSAGTIVAKLDRWKTLSLRFFEDIEPLLTRTDINLEKNKDFNKARYDLWIGLEKSKAISSQRIVDEQIEMAYVDLYGYNPIIEDIFQRAIRELKKIDKEIYNSSRTLAQDDIIKTQYKYDLDKVIILGELGRDLRMTCGMLGEKCERKMNEIIDPVRNELLRLINARDGEIVKKKIKISSSEEIFKTISNSAEDLGKVFPIRGKAPNEKKAN